MILVVAVAIVSLLVFGPLFMPRYIINILCEYISVESNFTNLGCIIFIYNWKTPYPIMKGDHRPFPSNFLDYFCYAKGPFENFGELYKYQETLRVLPQSY